METPITIIDRHFDIELTPDTLAPLAALPYDRWHEFAVAYKQYAEAFADLNANQLKPDKSILAPYLYESIPWGGGLGKPEIADTSVRVVEAEWLIASLKRLLLYHHRVFIPDWFLWLLDYVRLPGLSNVQLNDLVILRKDAESFAAWRDELTQIYWEAQGNIAIEERPKEFARYISARLRGKRRVIWKEVESRGLLAATQSDQWKLGMSMLGIGAAELLIPGSSLAGTLLGSFIGGALPIVLGKIHHKVQAPNVEARVRLYSVFDAQA